MNCHQTRELLEEYALGMLDPANQAQVDAHLDNCDDCRALAATYAETLSTLPEALARASSYALPELLKEKVIGRILAAPADLPDDSSATTASDTATFIPPQPVAATMRTWTLPQPRTRMALVAACLLLVVVLLWSIQLNVVLARERALRAEFAELVDQQELVLEVIDSNQTERRVLLPPVGDSRAYGKIFTRGDMPHVVAMAARLSPPAPGEAYHLWLTRDGHTFLAGTLRINDEGFGLVIYDDSVDGPQYSRAIVTLQPLATTTPVGPPVLEWVPEE